MRDDDLSCSSGGKTEDFFWRCLHYVAPGDVVATLHTWVPTGAPPPPPPPPPPGGAAGPGPCMRQPPAPLPPQVLADSSGGLSIWSVEVIGEADCKEQFNNVHPATVIQHTREAAT